MWLVAWLLDDGLEERYRHSPPLPCREKAEVPIVIVLAAALTLLPLLTITVEDALASLVLLYLVTRAR